LWITFGSTLVLSVLASRIPARSAVARSTREAMSYE
jgi:ABC-type lipoprotein release transport system permease subunit